MVPETTSEPREARLLRLLVHAHNIPCATASLPHLLAVSHRHIRALLTTSAPISAHRGGGVDDIDVGDLRLASTVLGLNGVQGVNVDETVQIAEQVNRKPLPAWKDRTGLRGLPVQERYWTAGKEIVLKPNSLPIASGAPAEHDAMQLE